MAYFTIDSQKCKHDGICAAECPVRLLELKDGTSIPTPVAGAEERCLKCGHCVAVCASGAFSLNVMNAADCPPVNVHPPLTEEQTEHFLRYRRSIRCYKEKPVEREKLARIIEISRYAPTASNSQKVGWSVVNSHEEVKKVSGVMVDFLRHMVKNKHPMAASYRLDDLVKAWDAGRDQISRGAPALVAIHAPKEYGIGQVDCALALGYFDLAAPSFGLGTCWGGFFMIGVGHWPPLQQALGIPDGRTCFGVMMVGYPKYKYHRLPLRNPPNIIWK